jgi:8-oxo-dGTP pyrophosphatase MutT (NUDIX family)
MSYTIHLLQQSESRYGAPSQIRLNYAAPREHFEFIRSTQKDGRAHDITLYLFHDRRLAVTRKPMYPPGAFRPPSGGIKPGESLEEGVAREGWEELGIRLAPVRYLLRVRLDFVCGGDRIPWTTHVFIVRSLEPNPPILNPQDTREIAQAVWAQEGEFFGPMRRGLIEMGSTGLLYRAHLHDFIRRKFGWG